MSAYDLDSAAAALGYESHADLVQARDAREQDESFLIEHMRMDEDAMEGREL